MRLPRRLKREQRGISPLSLDEFISYFSFNGTSYPFGLQQTLVGNKEHLGLDFQALVEGAYKRNGIVFACELVRLQHFSEARFQFRRRTNGRPGNLFGGTELQLLEQPWPGGTTGDLLTQMLLHADFGGSAFVLRLPGQLSLLRPDWVTIVLGSKQLPSEIAGVAPDATILGYVYEPGGPGGAAKPIPYLPEQVAQFTPNPDPSTRFSGFSWLHAVLTDIKGDKSAAQHKLSVFENGATPNMKVVFNVPDNSVERFKELVRDFKAGHEGGMNAYKTLFFMAGTGDAEVIGKDFKELDFKQTVGVSETRIAAAAGVPAVIAGLSEGLQGSSLNAGNYNAARRRFADGTMRPLWRNAAGSLARIVDVPAGAELWYDDRDIAFLREDMKERAEVATAQAAAIRQLTDAGFTAKSVVAAVTAEDLNLLVHSGMFSVQLQPPGSNPPDKSA